MEMFLNQEPEKIILSNNYVTIIMQTYPMERWMHGLCVKDVYAYGVFHSKSPRLMLLSIHSAASQSYEAKPRRMDTLKRFQDLLNRIPLGTNLSRASDGNYSGKDERPGRKEGYLARKEKQILETTKNLLEKQGAYVKG